MYLLQKLLMLIPIYAYYTNTWKNLNLLASYTSLQDYSIRVICLYLLLVNIQLEYFCDCFIRVFTRD